MTTNGNTTLTQKDVAQEPRRNVFVKESRLRRESTSLRPTRN